MLVKKSMKQLFLLILIVNLFIYSCSKKNSNPSPSSFNPSPAQGNADLQIKDTVYSSYTVSKQGYGASAQPNSGNYSFSIQFSSAPNNISYPLNSGNPVITIFNSGTSDTYYAVSGNAVATKTQSVTAVPYTNVEFTNAKFVDLIKSDTFTVSGAISY